MKTVIRNGRIIDPANGRDEVGDLWIVDGRIGEKSEIRTDAGGEKSKIDEIDATGLIVMSRSHRYSRPFPRAGLWLEGDHRIRRARRGSRRVHDGCLHAEHIAGG